jgi:DNA segregation ATPase FtsK/SpoIIIE-like protein
VVVFADPEQRPAVQAMLRAMVCQLCVWHGPDVVQVAIITEDAEAWEWAKWLPMSATASWWTPRVRRG